MDALTRLAQAESFLTAASLVLDDETDAANPGVAAALAVLAGIAAADAACCARLQQRARGQAHDEAVALLADVAPHGAEMAKDLQRLLNRKDAVHYGVTFLPATESARMVAWARRLLEKASKLVEA